VVRVQKMQRYRMVHESARKRLKMPRNVAFFHHFHTNHLDFNASKKLAMAIPAGYAALPTF
jgi:hypothetical protein